jgi:hypothetical protein
VPDALDATVAKAVALATLEIVIPKGMTYAQRVEFYYLILSGVNSAFVANPMNTNSSNY